MQKHRGVCPCVELLRGHVEHFESWESADDLLLVSGQE